MNSLSGSSPEGLYSGDAGEVGVIGVDSSLNKA